MKHQHRGGVDTLQSKMIQSSLSKTSVKHYLKSWPWDNQNRMVIHHQKLEKRDNQFSTESTIGKGSEKDNQKMVQSMIKKCDHGY